MKSFKWTGYPDTTEYSYTDKCSPKLNNSSKTKQPTKNPEMQADI